jgi:sugar transferase (PEP-CTERM/EpsH1 system associated)
MSDPKTIVHSPPLIAHIIYRLGTGGLENGLVNLINNLPADRYRHAVICLTDYSGFRDRIRRRDVPVVALHKREGLHPVLFKPLWKQLRAMRPDVVHTRNLATLEAQIPAYFLGVPHRVHGEHGRDVFDLHGDNRTYNLLRRLIRPLVQRYITVSRDLETWLQQTVGVPSRRVSQIYNGVDTALFRPRIGERAGLGTPGFAARGTVVIGTVGRMAAVKDHMTLVKAFLRMLETEPGARDRLRLVIIGDGPLREQVLAVLGDAGAASCAWIPGDRDDVPALLQAMDIFVLPSLGEGISNTLLEAMSSGLPVVATRVGGNPELVDEGITGRLVAPGDPSALADALGEYVRNAGLRAAHGAAARRRAEDRFSLTAMVQGYGRVYDALCQGASTVEADLQ